MKQTQNIHRATAMHE